MILDLAISYKLPVVSAVRAFVDEGGLLAYGVYIPDLFRQAAAYVDRILKGSKPADMPVEQPVKFEMIINRPFSSLPNSVRRDISHVLADLCF